MNESTNNLCALCQQPADPLVEVPVIYARTGESMMAVYKACHSFLFEEGDHDAR